jgi:Holliday junction resolvase RusA-like endonuclease
MISIKLPMPISVNQAYAWFKVRHKSNAYKKWEIEARNALRTQQKYTIDGDEWLSAMYIFYTDLHYKNGKKKVLDVANYEKVLSDLLCHEIPWLEDHKFLSMTLVKKQSTGEDYVDIFIEEVAI